jgi:putative transposase
MRKRHGAIRADTLRILPNAGKERAVQRFIADYRALVAQTGRLQWRLVFETGGTNKYAPAKHLNHLCGAAAVQMASFQAQEQIDSWLGNRANEFADRVRHSQLPKLTRDHLYAISRARAWFSRDEIEGIPTEVRALARSIMRHCMARHRRPNLSSISPRLDSRIATIEMPRTARFADRWLRLQLPKRGRILLPVKTHAYFDRRGGEPCPVVQICTEQGGHLSIRVMQDMGERFAAMRAAYHPKTDSLGIDFGLSTLIATSNGGLFGRGLMADLVRIDRQLTAIARHRSRSGDKPRNSARYRGLVTRLRGMLKTRINRALNDIVRLHAPAELAVERLDFRCPDLSRRMNRLVTNCGRAVFRAKLADLHDKYGITAPEMPSPYTSQECSKCNYVDRRNRRSQAEFECRFCGHRRHADVNAATVVASRRSAGLGGQWLTKGAILGLLVRQHVERWPRPQGTADDPRLSNPYFAGWARAARNALPTQGLDLCAQKQ